MLVALFDLQGGMGCSTSWGCICIGTSCFLLLPTPEIPQVRCTSSFELLASLRTIRPLLDQLAASPAGLACLLVDNVAAFHWLDRAARGPRAGGQPCRLSPSGACRG